MLKGKHQTPTSLRNWNDSIDILANGSPFIDKPIHQATENQIIQVLLEAQISPTLTKRLIDSLQIPSIKIGAPSQITRAVWTAGLLASLSCDLRLSPDLRIQLSNLQYPTIITCEAESAKTQALTIISETLLESTEFDQRSLEMWESWFIIVSQLQQASPNLLLQTQLIETILSLDIDLLRISNTRKVLGRVVQDTNWATSISARDYICDLIESEHSNSIDIALLTALFRNSNRITWFDSSFLVYPEYSLKDRISTATLIRDDWPVDSSAIHIVLES